MSAEEKDRKEILQLVKKYYQNHIAHENSAVNSDRISYGGRYFDADEMINLVDSSLDFWLT